MNAMAGLGGYSMMPMGQSQRGPGGGFNFRTSMGVGGPFGKKAFPQLGGEGIVDPSVAAPGAIGPFGSTSVSGPLGVPAGFHLPKESPGASDPVGMLGGPMAGPQNISPLGTHGRIGVPGMTENPFLGMGNKLGGLFPQNGPMPGQGNLQDLLQRLRGRLAGVR